MLMSSVRARHTAHTWQALASIKDFGPGCTRSLSSASRLDVASGAVAVHDAGATG